MKTLKKLYFDLTGTPYIKCWFTANGIVVKQKNYSMEEDIKNEFGKFEKPLLQKLLFFKDKYYAYYDINTFKQMDIEEFKDIISMEKFNERMKDEKFKEKVFNKIYNKENNHFILVNAIATPFEIQAMCERESLSVAFKPDKKAGDLLNGTNMIYLIIGLIVLYFGYRLMTTGSVF